jgi:hypothetical protein
MCLWFEYRAKIDVYQNAAKRKWDTWGSSKRCPLLADLVSEKRLYQSIFRKSQVHMSIYIRQKSITSWALTSTSGIIRVNGDRLGHSFWTWVSRLRRHGVGWSRVRGAIASWRQASTLQHSFTLLVTISRCSLEFDLGIHHPLYTSPRNTSLSRCGGLVPSTQISAPIFIFTVEY